MLPLPILPILGWTGGVAAGAQMVGGFVRGAGYLAHGRPGLAMREVVDGIASPFRFAVQQVGKLGADVVDTLVGLAMPPFPHIPPNLARDTQGDRLSSSLRRSSMSSRQVPSHRAL